MSKTRHSASAFRRDLKDILEIDKRRLFVNYDDSSDEEDSLNYNNSAKDKLISHYKEQLFDLRQQYLIIKNIADQEYLSQLKEEIEDVKGNLEGLRNLDEKDPVFLMESSGRRAIYQRSLDYGFKKSQTFGSTEFPISDAFEYDKILAQVLLSNGILTEVEVQEWEKLQAEIALYEKAGWLRYYGDDLMENHFKDDKSSSKYEKKASLFNEYNKFFLLRRILRQTNRQDLDRELIEGIAEFVSKISAKDLTEVRKKQIRDSINDPALSDINPFTHGVAALAIDDDPKINENREKIIQERKQRYDKEKPKRDKEISARIERERIDMLRNKTENLMKSGKLKKIVSDFKSDLSPVSRKLLKRTRVNEDIHNVDDLYSEERLRYRDLIRRSRSLGDNKFEVAQNLVFNQEQDLVSQKKQTVRQDNGDNPAKDSFSNRGTFEEVVFNLGNYRNVFERINSIGFDDSSIARIVRSCFKNGVDKAFNEMRIKIEEQGQDKKVPLSEYLSQEQKQVFVDLTELLFGTEGFRSPASITETNMLLDLIIVDPQNWSFRRAFTGKYVEVEKKEEENEEEKVAEKKLSKKQQAQKEKYEANLNKVSQYLVDYNVEGKEEVSIDDYDKDSFNAKDQIIFSFINGEKKYFNKAFAAGELQALRKISSVENGGALSYTMKDSAGSGGIACGRKLSQLFDSVVSTQNPEMMIDADEAHNLTLKEAKSSKSKVAEAAPSSSTKAQEIMPIADSFRSHKYGGSYKVNSDDFKQYLDRKREIAISWKERVVPREKDIESAISRREGDWYNSI